MIDAAAPGVVVVDDARDLRGLLVRALRADGRLTVLGDAPDGRQAIELVRRVGPQVVLMDVSMPVMDGLTATRALKLEWPDLKVVVLTGYGDERVRAEAESAGADGFLDKTTPLDRIADELTAVLGA